MRRRTTRVVGLMAAAGLALAACSSTSGTATPGSVTSAVAASSAGSSPSGTPSSAPSSSARPSSAAGPTSSPGGVELDEQSVSWFSTVCTGLTAVQQMQPPVAGSSLNDAGKTLTSTGQTLTRTAQELQDQPAPTFTGADDFAPAAQNALATVGSRLTELGQQAETLPPGDQAAGQQFLTEYRSFVQEMTQTLTPTLDLRKDVLQAVVDQVPDCQLLSSALGSGGN